jgi:O-antigen/teichoic acid export membrane protein
MASIPSLVSFSRIRQAGFSIADQALFVGGTFLANIVLARTQTKEEYGMFVLSYSIFTFLAGLHNAALLEPCTVYGSGRYRERFPDYLRLMWRSNATLCLVLSGMLLSACLLLSWSAPHYASRSLVGLGLTVGFLLSGIFLRRAFYLQRTAMFAAGASLLFSVTVALGLWITARARLLNGLSVFLILGLGWLVAGAAFARKLRIGHADASFLTFEPRYWREHWKYARWVLAATCVFQFTTQGYYWLLAGFLSVREVANLRAMYLLVGPVDQIFIAMSYLVLPLLASHHSTKRLDSLFTLWKRYALATIAGTALFALGVRMLGVPTMHLFYGGKFDGLGPLLFVLGFLPLLLGIGNTMVLVLNAMERPMLVFWAYISGGVTTFVVGIPLVMHFGLRGAVYGMLVSGSAYTAALAIAFFFNVYRKVRHHAKLLSSAAASGTVVSEGASSAR